MLDGVSILPGLDDQPGIAVLDGRAFETGQPDSSLRVSHARHSVNIGSVGHFVSPGWARACWRGPSAGRVGGFGMTIRRRRPVLDLDRLPHGAGEASGLSLLIRLPYRHRELLRGAPRMTRLPSLTDPPSRRFSIEDRLPTRSHYRHLDGCGDRAASRCKLNRDGDCGIAGRILDGYG